MSPETFEYVAPAPTPEYEAKLKALGIDGDFDERVKQSRQNVKEALGRYHQSPAFLAIAEFFFSEAKAIGPIDTIELACMLGVMNIAANAGASGLLGHEEVRDAIIDRYLSGADTLADALDEIIKFTGPNGNG